MVNDSLILSKVFFYLNFYICKKEDLTNNALIFYEQQKNAFYDQHFDNFSPQDLENLVGKYRVKKGKSQFPSPDHIFTKKFAFLDKTLSEILSENQEKVPQIEEKKCVEVVPKIEIKKVKTKLGIFLEEKPKNDTDSDNSFIIPPEFNEIITRALKSEDNNKLDEDIIEYIDSAPITKHELKESKRKTKWIDDLLENNNSFNNSFKLDNNETLLSRNKNILKNSNTLPLNFEPPLLLKLNDFIPAGFSYKEKHSFTVFFLYFD